MLTHIEGEGTFSLKAFRAGRATDLARRGVSLAIICTMAEWVSDSWKRYVREEGIDPNRVLCRQIEESDDDNSHLEPFS